MQVLISNNGNYKTGDVFDSHQEMHRPFNTGISTKDYNIRARIINAQTHTHISHKNRDTIGDNNCPLNRHFHCSKQGVNVNALYI